MLNIDASELQQLAYRIFKKVGAPDEAAEIVSDYMRDSHFYGHDTHGVIATPRFVNDVSTGKIIPDAQRRVVKQSNGTTLIDGCREFGYVTASKGMQLAIDMAKDNGVAAVGLTNCNHIGMLWGWAKMAADQKVIGLIFCASGPQGGLVAPFGGIKRAIGANPIAFGLPSNETHPLIMDTSTSVVAGGRVRLASEKDQKIPAGWILDKDGRPSTDPADLHGQGPDTMGSLLPMGGYKGYGLALLIELLGGVLTGYGCAYLPEYMEGNGTFIITVDIARFMDVDKFRSDADALFRHVKSNPTHDPSDEVLIPGEIEFRTKAIRERNGIPIPEKTWNRVAVVAEELDVEMPSPRAL